MIAIIAGTGNLPLHACKYFKKENLPFFVICLFPENNLTLLAQEVAVEQIIVQPFYKMSAILKTLKQHTTEKLLFIGKVDKQYLLTKLQYDFLFFKLAAKLLCRGDKMIMEGLVNELAKEGIEVMNQQHVLASLLIPPGVITGTLTNTVKQDIAFGLQAAQQMSKHDIGQTVIVKDKMILAVEAIEGTDECIKRGIAIGKKEIIVCKAACSNQNKKFDLPTLGPGTLKEVQKGQIKAIAWKASHTFISDKQEFIDRAQELGISLVSI